MNFTAARQNWLLILISIGLGCISAWAIDQHLSQKSKELEIRHHTDRVVRVVAARDLTRGAVISIDDLAKSEFPIDWVNADSIALEDLYVVPGKQLAVDLKAGQLLMNVHLIERTQPALAHRLSPDKRAVTIPVDLMSSMSGLLKPGDRIDLFVSFEYKGQRTTVSLLQGVEVLATGQQTRGTAEQSLPIDADFSTVTLATSHVDATKLIAARQNGTITAVLSHAKAEPVLTSRQTMVQDLPGLLGLETSSSTPVIEVIYGDRLVTEAPSSGVLQASDFNNSVDLSSVK
jgi:pilus assembly protein CpaB